MSDTSLTDAEKSAETFYDTSTFGLVLVHAFSFPHLHQGLAERYRQVPRGQKRLLEKVIDLLPAKTGDTVLDIGSGFGGTGFELTKRLDISVIGICNSRNMVSWARLVQRIYPSAREKVIFHVADFTQIDINGLHADHGVSIECASHIAQTDLYFEQAAAAIRSGGSLVIADFFAAHPAGAESEDVIQWKSAWAQAGFRQVSDYTAAATAAGFKVTHSEDLSQGIVFWTRLYRRIARGMLPFVRLLTLLRLQPKDAIDNCLGLISLNKAISSGHICYHIIRFERS